MKLQPVQIPPRPQGLSVKAFALAEPRFEVRAAEARIELFDQVDSTTPAKIAGALRSIGDRRATLAINSPGGDFYAGLTAHNMIVGHRAGVTTEVLGIAASAAALIAIAGDDVRMAKASQLMIHRASGGVIGNAGAMRQVADVLDKIDQTMVGIFAARTGLAAATITAMLEAESFLSSDEAIQYGFADGLLSQNAIAAPRMASATAQATHGHIESKDKLESLLRAQGLPRSVVKVGAGAMWAKMRGEPDAAPENIDFDAIAHVLGDHLAALAPRHRYR